MGKLKINWIFIILTPFQYQMMRNVFGDILFHKKSVIFHTEHITLENGKHKGECFLIPFESFSLLELQSSPFKKTMQYRKRISQIREYLKGFLQNLESSELLNLVIGSEKDNFTQVLLNLLFQKKDPKVCLYAIEEGLGYYVKEDRSDRLKALLYRALTPLLFGEKLAYHKQLGTDPRIAIRYVRLPELIPKYCGKKLTNLRKLDMGENNIDQKPQKGKALIYSFPNGDFGMDDDEKYEIYKILLTRLGGMQVSIKPHPRESVEVFSRFPGLKVFDKGSLGEDLDYFQYEQIVNFTSSVIIDILARGYPPKQILTVEMRKTDLPFFRETQLLKLKELKG